MENVIGESDEDHELFKYILIDQNINFHFQLPCGG